MIVGIITGTYSSMYIAASIAIILGGKQAKGGRPQAQLEGLVAAAVDLLSAALLGVVQGLTEFLPVSSSGHLILARAFFGWDPGRFGIAFDVACHVGTLLAVVAFFRADIVKLVAAAPGALSGKDGEFEQTRPADHRRHHSRRDRRRVVRRCDRGAVSVADGRGVHADDRRHRVDHCRADRAQGRVTLARWATARRL